MVNRGEEKVRVHMNVAGVHNGQNFKIDLLLLETVNWHLIRDK